MTTALKSIPNGQEGFSRYLSYSLAAHLALFILLIFLIPRAPRLAFGLTEVALYRESPGPARPAAVTQPVVRPPSQAKAEKLPQKKEETPGEKAASRVAKPDIRTAPREKEVPLKEKAAQQKSGGQPAAEPAAAPAEAAKPQPLSGIKGATGTATALEKGGIEGPAAKRRILFLVYPEYPAWARQRGIEMEAAVRFWVTPEGKVKRAETVRRSGWVDVDQSAEDAVSSWLFEPIPAGFKQEDQWGQVTLKFRLTD